MNSGSAKEFDVEKFEKICTAMKKHRVGELKTCKLHVIMDLEPTSIPIPGGMDAASQKQVSDEDILMDPYAGMDEENPE